MDRINQDFLEFIKLLEESSVEYMIVGGYAVGLHGFPRYTGDIDFFVAVDGENSKRLLNVFCQFGFGDIGLSAEDFLIPDFVVKIGREPRKIQILTGIDGVSFHETYTRCVNVKISNIPMRFIGKEDLIHNKRASGRAKDRIDVEELQRLDGKSDTEESDRKSE